VARDGSALVFDATSSTAAAGTGTASSGPLRTRRHPAPHHPRRSELCELAAPRTDGRCGGAGRSARRPVDAPEGDTARARPITTTSNGGKAPPASTGPPTAASSTARPRRTTGHLDRQWRRQSARQLTSDPGIENQPQVLPDGTGIIFTSRVLGASDVLVRAIDLDGGNPRPIATAGPSSVDTSRRAATRLLQSPREGPVAYRVPLAGGPRERSLQIPRGCRRASS